MFLTNAGHHIGRCLFEKILVAQFLVHPGQLFGELGDFLLQTGLLLGEIDDSFQHDVDRGTVHQHRSRRFGPRLGAVPVHLNGLQAGQVDDQVPALGDGFGYRGILGVDEDAKGRRRGDVHLAAHIADAGDDGNHHLHPGFRRGVVAGNERFRPAGAHDRSFGARQRVPDLLGDEGGEGVQQDQCLTEDVPQDRACGPARRAAALVIEDRLDRLQVPVAQLVPYELVDGAGGFVELVGVQGRFGLAGDPVET